MNLSVSVVGDFVITREFDTTSILSGSKGKFSQFCSTCVVHGISPWCVCGYPQRGIWLRVKSAFSQNLNTTLYLLACIKHVAPPFVKQSNDIAAIRFHQKIHSLLLG